ncbi:MAG: PilZ domain-containing protein [Candidatus Binataceae bacterium]
MTCTALTDMRKHRRARLQLGARVRWRSPLGMRLESTQTVDLSRGGILLDRAEPCDVDAHVWVVCPFDPASTSVQPETPARVVRVENRPGGYFRVALQLETAERCAPRPSSTERRRTSRIPFAIPIFVRPMGAPWPEESMTHDISRGGARFTTARIFAPGDSMMAKVPWGEWAQSGEIAGCVVRVESHRDMPGAAPLADPLAGSSALLTSVAVEWKRPAKG